MNKKTWPTYLFFPIPLLIPIIFLFTAEHVWSANLFVRPNGTGTSCSQSAPCLFTTAITNASLGDYIIFREGTYTRTASSILRIEKEIYLLGGWDGSPSGSLVINPELHPSILDGGNLRPVIHILGPIKTIISGFTIQNGNARDLPEQTVICEGGMRTGCGGGILVVEAEALIYKNKILNNQANDGEARGGGVHLEKASGTIVRDNLFQGNQAGSGGGLSLYGATSTPPTIENNNRFIQNSANSASDIEGIGGGVHLENGSGTIVHKNLFQGNTAKYGGGLGLRGSNSAPPEITDNQFIQNSAEAGGAIGFYSQTNPIIQDNFFDNNSAQMNNVFINGTGIQGEGNSTITRNLFQNHLGFSIANLWAFQGTFNANRLINNATMVGLYLINGIPPHPTVSNNFFVRSGTSSALLGLAMDTSSLLNAVIEHNTLVGEGIGTAIKPEGYCILSLNNNIISGFPIGIDATQSLAIVARHTLFDGSVTTPGNNVNFVNSLVGDPAFKDPAANDFHIKLTSAARDAGTPNFITTTQDIDGDPRPIGSAPDIGADEYKDAAHLYLPLIKK